MYRWPRFIGGSCDGMPVPIQPDERPGSYLTMAVLKPPRFLKQAPPLPDQKIDHGREQYRLQLLGIVLRVTQTPVDVWAWVRTGHEPTKAADTLTRRLVEAACVTPFEWADRMGDLTIFGMTVEEIYRMRDWALEKGYEHAA